MHTKFLPLQLVLIALMAMSSCDQKDNKNAASSESDQSSEQIKDLPYFPFQIEEDKGIFIITVEVESEAVMQKFKGVYDEYELSGNGYTWEGTITQILMIEDPTLLESLTLDSEAGTFYAETDSKANQMRFIRLMRPIFEKTDKLEFYLNQIPRDLIND